MEYTSFKTLKKDLEICFVEHILDAKMKHAPVGFFCILGIHYMIGNLFLFSCVFKTQTISILCVFIYYLITTLISFAVSVILMPNNAYFVQHHFNITPFMYNSNMDALSIGTRINFFWTASRHLMTSICFRIGLDLDVLVLVLSF